MDLNYKNKYFSWLKYDAGVKTMVGNATVLNAEAYMLFFSTLVKPSDNSENEALSDGERDEMDTKNEASTDMENGAKKDAENDVVEVTDDEDSSTPSDNSENEALHDGERDEYRDTKNEASTDMENAAKKNAKNNVVEVPDDEDTRKDGDSENENIEVRNNAESNADAAKSEAAAIEQLVADAATRVIDRNTPFELPTGLSRKQLKHGSHALAKRFSNIILE